MKYYPQVGPTICEEVAFDAPELSTQYTVAPAAPDFNNADTAQVVDAAAQVTVVLRTLAASTRVLRPPVPVDANIPPEHAVAAVYVE